MDDDTKTCIKMEDSSESKDQVVISGMSGRLPQSDSIDEFAYNLYNGIDMVTDGGCRWPPGKIVNQSINEFIFD